MKLRYDKEESDNFNFTKTSDKRQLVILKTAFSGDLISFYFLKPALSLATYALGGLLESHALLK